MRWNFWWLFSPCNSSFRIAGLQKRRWLVFHIWSFQMLVVVFLWTEFYISIRSHTQLIYVTVWLARECFHGSCLVFGAQISLPVARSIERLVHRWLSSARSTKRNSIAKFVFGAFMGSRSWRTLTLVFSILMPLHRKRWKTCVLPVQLLCLIRISRPWLIRSLFSSFPADIKAFTLIDDALVSQADLGSNFFCEPDRLGQSRAECVRDLLLEMNPDVQGHAENVNVVQLIRNQVDYFSRYVLCSFHGFDWLFIN